MIVISNFEVTKGYKVWKKAFESNEAMRQKNNVKVIAYGHEKGNESNVYTVVEMNSIEDKKLKDFHRQRLFKELLFKIKERNDSNIKF